jgi:DNA-binding XRE family transcriptional regulator
MIPTKCDCGLTLLEISDPEILGTSRENTKDMVLKNRQAKGNKINLSKLVNTDILKIRELYGSNEYKQCQLAELFNVSQATISAIIIRKTWRHI